MFKLVILSPGLAGRSLEVGQEWKTIGRADDSPFQIQEASISSHHCQVRVSGNDVVVRDLNSTNGTYIMGTRIRENTLKVGQKLRLGQVELRLVREEAPAASAPSVKGGGRKRVTVPPPAPHVQAQTPAEAQAPRSSSPFSITSRPPIPQRPPPPKPAPAAPAAPAPAPAPEPAFAARPARAARNAPPAQAAKYRVLLVDDSKPFLETVSQLFRVLANNSWDIQCTSAPDQALQILQKVPFDLVVLDVSMPMLDGVQLLGLIHRRHPDIKKCVLTSHSNDGNRGTCLAKGADLFMEKPLSGEGLKAVFHVLNELISCPSGNEGFCGTLRRVSLQDILQMECLRANSCILEILSRQVNGEIYIENGSIIHATAGALAGEPALFQLLSLNGGEFHSHDFKAPMHRSVNGQWEALLMEAARVRDETALISRSSVPAPAGEICVNPTAVAEVPSTTTATPSTVKPGSTPEDEFIVVATYDGTWNPANKKGQQG